MYSSYSFLTFALDGGEWSVSRYGKKPQYPLDRRLGGPQELVWTQRLEEKSFAFVRD
jgi:hypothetical protein